MVWTREQIIEQGAIALRDTGWLGRFIGPRHRELAAAVLPGYAQAVLAYVRARATRSMTPRQMLTMCDEIEAEMGAGEVVNVFTLLPKPDVEQLHAERIAFTVALGYGDDAKLDDLVEPLTAALELATLHDAECPRDCGECGHRLAATRCEHCNGSGCGPGTASGAYEECEWCAGVGWIHDGCTGETYEEVVARADAADQKLGRIRRYLNDPTSLVAPGEPRIVSVDGVLRYLDGLQ